MKRRAQREVRGDREDLRMPEAGGTTPVFLEPEEPRAAEKSRRTAEPEPRRAYPFSSR